ENVLVGAGYTSITARLPALTILSVIVGVAALACFANAFRGTLWILGGAIVLWFAATLVVGGVYPALIQNFIVQPDQLNKERLYISRNIAATRAAYSLDTVDESGFNVADTPTPAEARAALSDTTTVRLWDYRPLQQAFDQNQALRTQDTFVDDVIVDTNQEEFDYTTDQGNVQTRFSGTGGVGVGSLWDRLLFAICLGNSNLLVSNQITGPSKVLFHRQIVPREKLIAPFLEYDPDPYLVIANGKLYWMNDAFTIGDQYPYSERFSALGVSSGALAGGRLNYIR